MIIHTLQAISLMLLPSPRPCVDQPQPWHHLHWSDSSAVVDPSHRWQVEVNPIQNDSSDRSPVVLRVCRSGRDWPLLNLDRDAEMYWGPGGGALLIINAPTADDYEIRLFDLAAIMLGKEPHSHDELNDSLRREVQRSLGAPRQMQFYLVQFVTWKDGKLVLSVGGTTTLGALGPMTEYCFGAEIDTRTWGLLHLLSAGELASRFGGKCGVFP